VCASGLSVRSARQLGWQGSFTCLALPARRPVLTKAPSREQLQAKPTAFAQACGCPQSSKRELSPHVRTRQSSSTRHKDVVTRLAHCLVFRGQGETCSNKFGRRLCRQRASSPRATRPWGHRVMALLQVVQHAAAAVGVAGVALAGPGSLVRAAAAQARESAAAELAAPPVERML